jgi:heat-inducible transcriptional repressor
MSMSEREKLVLSAIIDYYLTYGETVGSRTLVKRYNMDLSSATIRNVMADLEEMGYITKTHTSSGRIPTDLGYKYYLDELLKVERISQEEMKKIELAYEKKMTELDLILKKTSSLLTKLTSYTGIAIEPSHRFEKMKKIELVHIDDYMVMAVIVMENSNIKTKKIHLEEKMTREEIVQLSDEINKKMKDGKLSSHDIEQFLKRNSPILLEIEKEADQVQGEGLFLNNAPSIFKDKNVSDVAEALELLDKKKGIKEIFEEAVMNKPPDYNNVHVILGDELPIKGLEDYSFVYSIYKVRDLEGVIGVLGPKRMSYSKTMGVIEHVTKEVNKAIDQISKKEKK